MVRVVGRFEDVSVSEVYMVEGMGEFVVGMKMGEVVVYKWGVNKFYGRDVMMVLDLKFGGLMDISMRVEFLFKEGF